MRDAYLILAPCLVLVALTALTVLCYEKENSIYGINPTPVRRVAIVCSVLLFIQIVLLCLP